MTALVWMANLLGWPVIHLLIASAFLRLPQERFRNDTWLTAPRRWERARCLYRDRLRIRRWKAMLPDAAPWLGGFARKNLRSRDPVYLARFLLETRRAELAHWWMLACLHVGLAWLKRSKTEESRPACRISFRQFSRDHAQANWTDSPQPAASCSSSC
jgi:glycosyl-4,4'-diaponeurosporenoate acyltransferase